MSKKISELTTATDVTVNDFFQVVDLEDPTMATSGTNKKISARTLGNFLPVTATGSSASRSLKDRFADTANVKDFGAVGDGVTDDTSAIQAALNSGVVEVILPKGVFLCGTLTLPSNVSFRGLKGVLKATAVRYQILLAANCVNSSILNIDFDASNLSSSDINLEKSCISTTGNVGIVSGIIINGCRFLNLSLSIGQRIHSVQLFYGEAQVSNNYTPQCGGDIYNFNNGRFIVTNNIALNSKDGGIAFNNVARGVIANNYIYKCDLGIGAGPEGTDSNPDHTLLISANEIEACGDGINMGYFGYDEDFKQAPINVKIIGNTIADCLRTGIRYDPSPSNQADAYVIIIGNTIHNTGNTIYGERTDATFGAGLRLNGKNIIVKGNILHDNYLLDVLLYGSNHEFEGNILNAGGYINDLKSALDFNCSYSLVTNNIIIGRRALIQSGASNIISNNKFTCASVTANQGGLVISSTSTDNNLSDNLFESCGNGIFIASESAAWYSNDIFGTNKFINCTNSVVNSLFTREGDSYVECYYLGVVASDGTFDLNHGLGTRATYSIVSASAFWRGNIGEANAMALSYIDGGKIRFTGGTATKVVRAWLRINKNAPSW